MLSAVVAQTPAGDTGGFDVFGLLLPLALAFLIFTMFRRQRKAQKQVKEMRTQLEPGSEVMTQFGLFGTIVSIDQENNRAVLELSPGNHATVHTQALSKVVQQDPVQQEDTTTDADRRNLDSYDGTVVPDDASSLDGASSLDDGRPVGGATAAGESRPAHETPEQTLERLDREQSHRDERDTRGPGGTTGTSDH